MSCATCKKSLRGNRGSKTLLKNHNNSECIQQLKYLNEERERKINEYKGHCSKIEEGIQHQNQSRLSNARYNLTSDINQIKQKVATEEDVLKQQLTSCVNNL